MYQSVIEKTDIVLSLWDLATPRWFQLVQRLAGYHDGDDSGPPRGRLKTMPLGSSRDQAPGASVY